jgi:hypothetical protein
MSSGREAVNVTIGSAERIAVEREGQGDQLDSITSWICSPLSNEAKFFSRYVFALWLLAPIEWA